MAYFSGSISARPWPKIDLWFVLIFACSFLGLALCLVVARDLPLLKGAEASVAGGTSKAQLPAKSIPVAVAIETVPAGTWLTPQMVRFELRSVSGSEGQVVQNPDELRGVFARAAIPAGAPLLKVALARGSGNSEITDRIPAGYRAVAIPINALTGVEGWVQPGASVDVVWSIERDKQLTVSTIVENARVLSVERSLEPTAKSRILSDSSPNHITLLVSTQDAQKIQLAKGAGSLQLSLRGADDVAVTGNDTLTTESVLTKPRERQRASGRVVIDGREYVLRGSTLTAIEEDLAAGA
jgi:pilus assembly protein CpaB